MTYSLISLKTNCVTTKRHRLISSQNKLDNLDYTTVSLFTHLGLESVLSSNIHSWQAKIYWAILPEKIQTGGLRIYFSEKPPGNFRYVTLPQKIPEKKSFYPWKFCKFVWHPLEILQSKTKTHGNSALVFLEHPWNFHFFFNQPLWMDGISMFFLPSSRPPEIPCPQPPLFWFFLEVHSL